MAPLDAEFIEQEQMDEDIWRIKQGVLQKEYQLIENIQNDTQTVGHFLESIYADYAVVHHQFLPIYR
jgi:hypothetical protein